GDRPVWSGRLGNDRVRGAGDRLVWSGFFGCARPTAANLFPSRSISSTLTFSWSVRTFLWRFGSLPEALEGAGRLGRIVGLGEKTDTIFDLRLMSTFFVTLLHRKQNMNVTCKDNASFGTRCIPNPIRSFEDAFHHYPEIMDNIVRAGFKTPSPIQGQAWPVVMLGMDVIGIAQTGTGKTLVFLFPGFIHLDSQSIPRNQRGGPGMLILTPTRELALQIQSECQKYQYKGITSEVKGRRQGVKGEATGLIKTTVFVSRVS
uniref:Helicase ATP-binding domain-containing protein n=1 Tax=Eptatretus burgeri TaxID=7764 RepID=A0A8C4N3I8_EPTBU